MIEEVLRGENELVNDRRQLIWCFDHELQYINSEDFCEKIERCGDLGDI